MHILITGATGGIGQQLIEALQSQNIQITAHGRNPEILQKLVKAYGVETIQADITTDVGINTLHQYAINKPIDILINNAGVLHMQDFATASNQSITDTINVNVIALLNLTHKILPLMLAKKSPSRIVNIGSVAGSLAMPYLATYCASKYAVKGFSESLHRELYDTPVNITYIAPRGVNTSMISNSERRVFKAIFSRIDSPEVVAKAIANTIKKNSPRLTIGRLERLFCAINSTCPALIDGFFWLFRNRIRKARK